MTNEENNKIDYPPNAIRSDVGLPPIIHHGTPELIGKLDENKYIYDICYCPLPYGYAIKIPWNDLTEHEKETGVCRVYCDNCGNDSIICFRPRAKALRGLRANIVNIDESESNRRANSDNNNA